MSIEWYRNKYWVTSGHKRAYQRVKLLSLAVSECNKRITDSFLEGSDREWNFAIFRFIEKWSRHKSMSIFY